MGRDHKYVMIGGEASGRGDMEEDINVKSAGAKQDAEMRAAVCGVQRVARAT